ncbi:CBS domain-containing protein [Toxoplasma gondii MAS]|uniref:CBS domain-containing protein n=1 Tax=Toxoplasma gondii MAS TaxID=943118 RepID=A0A086Q6V2_TOXGO|nr:CBS domain-containing protein [Toxoplasma gondii MAS]
MSDGLAAAIPPAGSITLAVFCAIGSAMFSGLTLGLLTLDIVQLKLLINRPNKTAQDERNAKYARKILPLRSDGNYLLVTLLTGNVAVNAGFSILLGDLTDGLVGFLVSTVVITIFGEILPQAACARHGLVVGGVLAPVVYALEWLLFPVVKPIAMILNCVLGEDLGTIYDKKQLSALVDYHNNVVHVLTRDEARILKGGLEFAFTRAEEVMTPMDEVYGIDVDSKLNYDVLSEVLSSGFSRIPVFDRSNSQCIVGLLFVKDLILVDCHAEVEVRKLLQFFGRGLYAVDDDTPLLELLKTFKQGHTHLAVVRRVSDDGEGDPFYIHVGIITLEDVMEEILQDEINDEFEHDKSQSHRRRRHQNQAVSGAQASLPYFAPSSPLAPRFSVSSTAWEAQGDVDTAPEAESRRSRREKKKEKVKGDKRRFRLWSRGRRSSTASSNAPLTNACEKEAGEGTDGDVEDKRVDRNEASRRPSKEASFPATCASTLQARRPGEAETDLLSGGSPVGLSSFEKSSECGDPERGSLGEASSRHSRWTAKRLEEGGAVESHFLEDEPTRELPRGDTEEGEGQRRRSRGGAAGEKTIKTVEMTPLEPMHAVLTTSREEPPKAEEIRREDALGHPSLFPWWGWSADTAGSVSKLRMRGTLRMFFDSHRRSRIAEPLTESEARAIASFLSSSIPAFSPQIVDEKLLVSLLSSFFCIQPPPASLLWHSAVHPDLFKHKSTDKRGEHEAAFEPFAVIVLYGRVRLYVGKEGIPCTAGPLSCLAVKVLGNPAPVLLGQVASQQPAEFSAPPSSPSPSGALEFRETPVHMLDQPSCLPASADTLVVSSPSRSSSREQLDSSSRPAASSDSSDQDSVCSSQRLSTATFNSPSISPEAASRRASSPRLTSRSRPAPCTISTFPVSPVALPGCLPVSAGVTVSRGSSVFPSPCVWDAAIHRKAASPPRGDWRNAFRSEEPEAKERKRENGESDRREETQGKECVQSGAPDGSLDLGSDGPRRRRDIFCVLDAVRENPGHTREEDFLSSTDRRSSSRSSSSSRHKSPREPSTSVPSPKESGTAWLGPWGTRRDSEEPRYAPLASCVSSNVDNVEAPSCRDGTRPLHFASPGKPPVEGKSRCCSPEVRFSPLKESTTPLRSLPPSTGLCQRSGGGVYRSLVETTSSLASLSTRGKETDRETCREASQPASAVQIASERGDPSAKRVCDEEEDHEEDYEKEGYEEEDREVSPLVSRRLLRDGLTSPDQFTLISSHASGGCSSSPSLHDASSGGVSVEEAPQGSQTKSPSTGRSGREKTACDVDSACVEIDIGNRRASTFEKDAFRRKETYPQFGDTERSCRTQNEMLSWLRTSATSSVSLESGEEDVELTAPSQAHSHVRLEEVCVCGVSLSLPWLSPKKGTDREQRRRAREEGLCLGLSREEPPEGESSVEGTSLEKKEEQSAGASAGRRRLPSEKSSLAFPAFSSQRLSGKSIFRRETAGTGVSEISHLLRFEKPQADWSAARGPEPGPRREREEERQEELSCGWGANRQEGPAKPRVQQSLEEQLQIQETCLRQLAKDMQEKKGVWLAVSSKQRGKEYQRRRDVEFVDEQDKAERSSQAKSEREGREKQDASARGAAETGEAGAENEEPEGDGKKRIQEVRNREALCHEIHSWVQSLQDSKGGSEARGNEWSNEQTKTLTCEGYAPDYTAVTEGACGLLVFPRWFYVAAVKASLDLARSSRS